MGSPWSHGDRRSTRHNQDVGITDVGVCGCRVRLGRRLDGQTVLAGAEDVLDGVIAAGAERQRAGAGRLEPDVSVTPPQLHDPQTGAIALLGMRAALQDLGNELSGRRSDLVGPADQA